MKFDIYFFYIACYIFLRNPLTMKRTGKNLDTGNLNTESDVATNKKKVRFEKPLDNKAIGKNINK